MVSINETIVMLIMVQTVLYDKFTPFSPFNEGQIKKAENIHLCVFSFRAERYHYSVHKYLNSFSKTCYVTADCT